MKRDLGILRHRPYRNIFAARAVSLLGTSMAPTALAFAILGQPGGSAAELGIVMAGRSIAQVIFLLFGGALADRLLAIGEHCASLPDLDSRSPDEIVGYDESGMWR